MTSGPSSIEMNVAFMMSVMAIFCLCGAFMRRPWWACTLGATLCVAGLGKILSTT